ncbi:nuclear transport factor 2 family protein [Caenibius sp. WL]|uniref:nuclear transport factor 2 family protein n=1 Tax=Caenibius sp. WL TaxID=2872646 RepID=UPI001C999EBB|nr:nuclear transport factor 2 family protein [Caenibius sp. WL]QZP09217.1 nuclear transport factor 2 family protein [Caenibius sp. WL]
MGFEETRRAQLRTLFAELIGAYGRKDFETFARYVDEQAVFEWPYLPLKEFPSRMVGRDAFIETSRVGMEDCDGYHHQIDTFYDQLDPDTLIVEYHSDTTLRSSGIHYSNKYLGILRFEGDQVVYWKEYVNPIIIAEAFGLNFQNEAANS